MYSHLGSDSSTTDWMERQVLAEEKIQAEKRAKEKAKEDAWIATEITKYIREMKQLIDKNPRAARFKLETLCKLGRSSAEYQKVEGQTLKYLSASQKWLIDISKIEKITNLDLEEKFELARSAAFDPTFSDEKFYETNKEAAECIILTGFNLPSEIGEGLNFASHSFKRIRENKPKLLLLCKVLLGKSMSIAGSDPNINVNSLRRNGFDSVHLRKNNQAGICNDEFIIYQPECALPRCLIHYSWKALVHISPPEPLLPLQSTSTTIRFHVKNVKASRDVNTNDPYENDYLRAENHFLKMVERRKRRIKATATATTLSASIRPTIESIDIVTNLDLKEKFEAKAKAFEKGKIPHKPILAYHGTKGANIDSIIRNNFNMAYSRRHVFGKGHYFSEFPDISIGYGDGLLLCQILPGREFVDRTSSSIPTGYNSKKVNPDATLDGCGEMNIVEDSDQILPCYVIHLKK